MADGTAVSTSVRGIVSPYTVGAISKRRWWKIFPRGADPGAARQEIENLLAGADPEQVGKPAVELVFQRRGVRAGAPQGELRRSLYEQAVVALLGSRLPEPTAGVSYLRALRHTLGVSEGVKSAVDAKLVVPRLTSEFDSGVQRLARGDESDDEFDAIAALFDVPPETLHAIQRAAIEPMVKARASALLAQRTVSPDDVAQFGAFAGRLHVQPEWDPGSRAVLRAAMELWAIENGGPLPVVDVGAMQLQRGEVCHMCEPAEWYEMRSVRTSAGSVGFYYPLGGGLNYRSPRTYLGSAMHEAPRQIDAGYLYITNKRVIFNGQNRNTTLRTTSLLGFTQYSDGLQLQKTSGRNPIFIMHSHAAVAGLVLARVLEKPD